MATPVFDDVDVVVATILEDAGLDVVIALLGVVVQMAQPILCHVVIAHVVLHGGAVLVERVADIGGQRQTDVTVDLGLVGKNGDGHGLQTAYQRVVAGDVVVGFFQIGVAVAGTGDTGQ